MKSRLWIKAVTFVIVLVAFCFAGGAWKIHTSKQREVASVSPGEKSGKIVFEIRSGEDI